MVYKVFIISLFFVFWTNIHAQDQVAYIRKYQDLAIAEMMRTGIPASIKLAQAILEYMVGQKKPYLLFATHYHELTGLAQLFPQIHNAHMSVLEKGQQIHFQHTLRPGPANRSYGIHVAKLAGLPSAVTTRAQQILHGFEGQGGAQLSFATAAAPASAEPTVVPAWLEEVKGLDLSHMTPLEALNKLSQWQREASS